MIYEYKQDTHPLLCHKYLFEIIFIKNEKPKKFVYFQDPRCFHRNTLKKAEKEEKMKVKFLFGVICYVPAKFECTGSDFK